MGKGFKMNADEHQTYSEQSSEPTPVLIEDYRGPAVEQLKPYPSKHQMVPTPATPTHDEPEPQWIEENRNLEKMTNFRRLLMRRTGEDDPVIYAAARGLGWAVLSVVMMVAVLTFLLVHQDIPISNGTSSTYRPLDWNAVAGAFSITMLVALFITVPSSLVDALRVRGESYRASKPARVRYLSNIALTLTALVIVAAIIVVLVAVWYYSHVVN